MYRCRNELGVLEWKPTLEEKRKQKKPKQGSDQISRLFDRLSCCSCPTDYMLSQCRTWPSCGGGGEQHVNGCTRKSRATSLLPTFLQPVALALVPSVPRPLGKRRKRVLVLSNSCPGVQRGRKSGQKTLCPLVLLLKRYCFRQSSWAERRAVGTPAKLVLGDVHKYSPGHEPPFVSCRCVAGWIVEGSEVPP